MKISVTTSLAVSLFVFIISIYCLAEASVIRSVNSNGAHHVIHKRNAWWSKKSTDASRIPEDTPAVLQVEKIEELQEVKDAIDCYTNECVPEFVYCGRKITSQSGFVSCKLEHRLCASRCFENSAAMPEI